LKALVSGPICGWALLLLVGACQGRSSRENGASTTPKPAPSAAVAPRIQAGPTLPEDPVAGARSLLLWQQHLEEEEEERRANYDRRHSREHRAIVAQLLSAQQAYERAKTAAGVKQVQRSAVPGLDSIRKQIKKVDRWRVSSNLLKNYDAVLEALTTTYPAARLAEIAGEGDAATKTRRAVQAQFEKIDEWLARAERAEDE
jgi:hypothetical protein